MPMNEYNTEEVRKKERKKNQTDIDVTHQIMHGSLDGVFCTGINNERKKYKTEIMDR